MFKAIFRFMKNFIKSQFIVVCLLLCTVTNSLSEVVKKINISGNERISNETIIVFGDIAIDQNYEANDINLIIKKLFETKFFSDIKVELKNGILNINVKENKIINSIIFKGIKADKYKDAITQLLEFREKTPYIKKQIKKDVNQIKRFYKHSGFYFIEVEVEIQELGKNRVNIVYSIDPGERAKIAKIFFLGDKKVRDNKLRSIITSTEAKFWKVLSKNVYLNQGRIELDKRLLENYYKNKGYYEVQISSSNVEYIEY